jgi:hypothetical protein
MSEPGHNTIGHEADGTDVRAVGITGIALAIGIAIVFFIVFGMFQYLLHHPVVISPASPLAETGQQQFPPPPRIEDHPTNELNELHSVEERTLSTYGWVDKNKGIVRIPIDRAMELQLNRGFPVRKEAAAK